MKISLNPTADKLIADKLGTKSGLLRLVYDTENCGCGMSGVPVLHIVSEPGAYDIPMENEVYPFWIDKMQAIFFEEELTLKGKKTPVRSD